MKNLLENLPVSVSEELIDVLAKSDSVRIERIVSTGQCSPEGYWYDQQEHEFVLVIKGEARLMLEGDDHAIEMKEGDCLNIPAHQRHRVVSTSHTEPTVWLAVFY